MSPTSQQESKQHDQTVPDLHKGILLLMLGIIVALSVSVVAMKEKVRIAQTKLFAINSELQLYQESWGELMLQKTHLESPAKVELVAKQTLRMQSKPSKILTLKLLPQPAVSALQAVKSTASDSVGKSLQQHDQTHVATEESEGD